MKLNHFRTFSVSLIWFWLGLFALIPIVLTFVTSFMTSDGNHIITHQFTLHNYYKLFNSGYFNILLRSLYLAGSCTLLCLILAYPFSYIIARHKSRYRALFLLLVIIPFWTSSLIRTYAIMAIIKAKGLLNLFLLATGIIEQPLSILYTQTAIMIGCVYDLLPFMILPLYANIEKLNPEFIEAARDLGAKKITTFIKIIIPLTIPGIITGSVLVFLPAMTMFYIPVLLGGSRMLIGNLIEHQFLALNNWPMGATLSIFLSIIMCLLILIYWYNSDRNNLT